MHLPPCLVVASSVRVASSTATFVLPCHKRNFILLHCVSSRSERTTACAIFICYRQVFDSTFLKSPSCITPFIRRRLLSAVPALALASAAPADGSRCAGAEADCQPQALAVCARRLQIKQTACTQPSIPCMLLHRQRRPSGPVCSPGRETPVERVGHQNMAGGGGDSHRQAGPPGILENSIPQEY